MNPPMLRSMQSLSQDVWRTNPALINVDATMGELAWSWGSEVETPGVVYEHRLWKDDDRLVAWAFIVPPQLITISADPIATLRDGLMASLRFRRRAKIAHRRRRRLGRLGQRTTLRRLCMTRPPRRRV